MAECSLNALAFLFSCFAENEHIAIQRGSVHGSPGCHGHGDGQALQRGRPSGVDAQGAQLDTDHARSTPTPSNCWPDSLSGWHIFSPVIFPFNTETEKHCTALKSGRSGIRAGYIRPCTSYPQNYPQWTRSALLEG